MGFTLLLLMFAAITFGGLGNPFGALVGALVIGLMVELWTWIVPNANDLKNVGALIALIVILLIRPQGILGTQGTDRMNWSLIFWNALYAAINANAAAYCLIATGLNVHVGYTGLLNFGQAAFAAVGAYAFAIPIANYGWHWYFALPFVFACSVLLALLLGIPTLRLRADYLAIVTIAASPRSPDYLLGSTRFTLADRWQRRQEPLDARSSRISTRSPTTACTTSASSRSTATGCSC